MRPANIVTAFADILAGMTIGLSLSSEGVASFLPMLKTDGIWLLISTFGLYGGGVVFNDYFDAKLDQVERPERPIPSGRATKNGALILGLSLLLIGFICAYQVNTYSFMLALMVGALAVIYDKFSKHNIVIGPLNMGMCRAGNLLLGLSAFPVLMMGWWPIGIIPIIFVAAITFISQGEVSGGRSANLWIGLLLYCIVFTSFMYLFRELETNVLYSWPFLVVLIYLVVIPLIKAIQIKKPAYIRKAVKAGVLSLIVLNATFAAAFGLWQIGILILILLPVSMGLAKVFAVT